MSGAGRLRADVIVVGGGPVGLVLAWRLALAGLAPLVLEREPAIPRQLRASTFHPPTLDLLEPDGVTAVLGASGRITPDWQVRLHETGERAVFDLAVLADDTRHPFRLQCHQHVLSTEIAARLERLGAPVRFGAAVTAVGERGAGVTASLADGREVEGRFLVGCDGARSLVRDAIGGSFDGAAYPEITVLATTTFDFAEAFDGLSGVNYIWKPGGTFSLLRLPDVWRCSFLARPEDDTGEAVRDAALAAHLDEILPGRGRAVPIIERRPYRVHQRLASRWRRGPLFLAGDAAHLNSPKGGMGLNGGIHDAWELAGLLREAFDGHDRLDRYEARRRPVVAEEIIAQADANRARMAVLDAGERRAELVRLQAIAADPERARPFLLKSSMIAGLRRAREAA